MRRFITGVLVVALGTLPVSAHAQAAPADLTTRVQAIEAEVEAARQALATVEARLATLEEELARARRQTETESSARHRVDVLEARVRSLREEVAGLRATVRSAEEGAPATTPIVGEPTPGGLTLESADGRFSFEPRVLLQLDLSTVAAPEGPNLYTFSLRRARFGFDGHLFTETLRYHAVAELVDFVQMVEFYAEGDLPMGFGLRGGRFRVPFGRAQLVEERDLSFIHVSQAAQEYGYGRDVGLLGWWRSEGDRVVVQAAVQNGAGRASINENQFFLYSARVVGAVTGKLDREEGDHDGHATPGLQVGASSTYEQVNTPTAWGYLSLGGAHEPRPITNRDVDGNGEIDTLWVWQGGVDVALRWRGLGIEAEGFARHDGWRGIHENQGPSSFDPETTFLGGYVQATYFVIPGRMQVGARGSYAQLSSVSHSGQSLIRNASVCDAGGGELFVCPVPIADAVWETAARVAYFRWRTSVELAAEYVYRRHVSAHAEPMQGDGPIGFHSFIVEGQVAF